MKTLIHTIVVVIVGSLVGTTLIKIASIIWQPNSNVITILQNSINTGLNPTTIDLGIIQLTAGCIFKFNFATVIGIFITSIIYKQIIK
ncbi:MAG: DUF4321 domain-containing protein [Elusimicrobiales bacterium]|nr:DUF4321 domain-containing protein [Elusimicrobiales bacterium]